MVAMLAAAAAAQTPAPPPAPHLTLQQALAMARQNSAQFQAAVVAEGVASAARTQAHAALLPSVSSNNSFIWTEDNIFVANDGPHEFLSLGNVHEAYNFASRPTLKRADAGVALARAQAEIAARGLAATVVADYYTLVAAGHKVATAEQAVADAEKYLTVSQDRERQGAAAHADVIKAQIELQQKQRDLGDARLAEQQARLGLAVLIFPTLQQDFTVADDLDTPPPLPGQTQVTAMAAARNPALAAAEAALAQSRQDVSIARAGLLPGLTLDYFYGIDAHQFATKNVFGDPNLGSETMATLTIPVFDWGASRAKLHASVLEREQAQRELSQTQRQLLAALAGDYAEARTARDALASLASSRDLAAESLRLTALRYQNGDATILDLVDAQNTLSQARNAYDDGEVRYRVALAQLQTLTGTF